MLKEFLPAVEWLEMDYPGRDAIDNGWRVKPRLNPDGSHPHEAYDLNTYRRGPFQIFNGPSCGAPMSTICEDANAQECTCGDHQGRYMECYCFRARPGSISGIEWSEEDEERWLKFGAYFGVQEREHKYLEAVHPYVFEFGFDDRPNNTDWWK